MSIYEDDFYNYSRPSMGNFNIFYKTPGGLPRVCSNITYEEVMEMYPKIIIEVLDGEKGIDPEDIDNDNEYGYVRIMNSSNQAMRLVTEGRGHRRFQGTQGIVRSCYWRLEPMET